MAICNKAELPTEIVEQFKATLIQQKYDSVVSATLWQNTERAEQDRIIQEEWEQRCVIMCEAGIYYLLYLIDSTQE